MKVLKIALAAVLATSMGSCTEEDDERQQQEPPVADSPYQGDWEFSSREFEEDSTIVVPINREGKFSYSVPYQGEVAHLQGKVDLKGDVSGDISWQQVEVGSLQGKLELSGKGNGNYYFGDDAISWSAEKKEN